MSGEDFGERVFRAQLLLRQAGMRFDEAAAAGDSWLLPISGPEGFRGSAAIEGDQAFLELGCVFRFDAREAEFLRARMEDFMRVCYQYGCYHTIGNENGSILISVFSKLYFSGLEYYALRDTLADLQLAAQDLRRLFDAGGPSRGEHHGHP